MHSSGNDLTGMGRWSWTCFKWKGWFMQVWPYIGLAKVVAHNNIFGCLSNRGGIYFPSDNLTATISQWNEKGDKIIVLRGLNDNIV